MVAEGVGVAVSVAVFVIAAIFHYGRWADLAAAIRIGATHWRSALGPMWEWARPVLSVPVLDFSTTVKDFFSFWAIPALMGGLLLYGAWRGVRVYESLVEGAKEGFRVAVRIIPYLVAIIVAVAMFKASGAMELLKQTVGVVTGAQVLPAGLVSWSACTSFGSDPAGAHVSVRVS